jgi:putative copper export protein/mono/diheme cytochrome c family protein
MNALDIIVSLLRGAHVAALVSLLGTLTFVAFVAPPRSSHLRRVLLRLVWISAASALVTGVAWLQVDAAVIADADNLATALNAVPVVALQTQYGRWFLLRCAVLVAVPLVSRIRRIGIATALILSGIALAMQPMLGHAGAIGGGVEVEMVASEVLHLLAAGAWLGGLVPLFIAVGNLPQAEAAATCRNFTPIGLSAVLVLAGTAVVQIAQFAGGMPGLFGTTYGHIALVKLALFLVLLTLAALNRFLLTDRLAATPHSTTLHMRLSVAAEAALGALVVVTAGLLASSTPGTHEQPVWPFPWRPSLAAFADPGLRRELIIALVATTCGLAVAVAALGLRRRRWFAFGMGLAVVIMSIPRLGWLFVPAWPSSFFSSPSEFAATAIVHGEKLYGANCVICHGLHGHGDGPAASSLPMAPLDLTAEHLWAHTDGDLYWYIAHGFTTQDGKVAMPGFAGTLSDEAIWDLIDYLHAHNDGEGMQRTGKWPHPLPVPQFDAACADGRTVDLDDLRGRPLRIIAAAEELPAKAVLDVTTIVVTKSRAIRPLDRVCVATEPQTWTALAILLGLPPDDLAGAQVLADQNGVLREAWRPEEALPDSAALAATVRDITAHPIAIPAAGGHVHRQ